MPMPPLEAGEEVAPVDLGFGEGAGDSEDHSFAVFATHADGDKCGVESEVDDVWKRA